MPTGSHNARAQRGFSYLAVLFLVALTAAGLAVLGQAWSTAVQREKERELEFRGKAIADAITSYRRAASTEPAAYPASLEDLLEDRRGSRARRHLRRLYVDPFTGAADWVLVADPSNPKQFLAVHSRSDTVLLRHLERGARGAARARDWVFAALP